MAPGGLKPPEGHRLQKRMGDDLSESLVKLNSVNVFCEFNFLAPLSALRFFVVFLLAMWILRYEVRPRGGRTQTLETRSSNVPVFTGTRMRKQLANASLLLSGCLDVRHHGKGLCGLELFPPVKSLRPLRGFLCCHQWLLVKILRPELPHSFGPRMNPWSPRAFLLPHQTAPLFVEVGWNQGT